jgi:hypothetical protein
MPGLDIEERAYEHQRRRIAAILDAAAIEISRVTRKKA